MVAVFVVLAAALLPAPYVPFGVMGAFPFLVIAGMAAWRQRGQLKPARVAQLLDEAAQLSWRDFSARLVQGLTRQGYTVQVLEGAGADLLLTRAAQTTVVSCKRWKAASHGVDAVRALLAAQATATALQGERMAAWIALYRAAGGGWEHPQAGTPSSPS